MRKLFGLMALAITLLRLSGGPALSITIGFDGILSFNEFF